MQKGNKLKVAILQKKSLDRQFTESTEIVIKVMQEASHNGADIVLLPESFLTGYELPMRNGEALADNNPYLEQICKAAGKFSVGVVATAITRGQKSRRILHLSLIKKELC